jgi:hypothetical protein
MPKWQLLTIPKGDGGRGIEDLHVFIIARVAGSHPNLSLSFHSSQGQRKRRAMANLSRSRISRPP